MKTLTIAREEQNRALFIILVQVIVLAAHRSSYLRATREALQLDFDLEQIINTPSTTTGNFSFEGLLHTFYDMT